MPAVPLSLCHYYLHASLLGATSLHLQDRLIGSLTYPNDTLQAKFRIAGCDQGPIDLTKKCAIMKLIGLREVPDMERTAAT